MTRAWPELLLIVLLTAACSTPRVAAEDPAPAAGTAAAEDPAPAAGTAATEDPAPAAGTTPAPAPGATASPDTLTIPGTDVQFTMVRLAGGAVELSAGTTTLSPFWIQAHEVTFDEYAVFRNPDRDSPLAADPDYDVDAVARPSPPYEDPSGGQSRPGYPATGMTQWGALQYARWLSQKTGDFYRLPTEAEWEYACLEGEPRDVNRHAWHWDNSGEEMHPVGSAAVDAAGLYDMLGNVAEWMLDEYQEDFTAVLRAEPLDPWARPERLHPRTVRGGAYDDDPALLACSYRLESTLDWKRRDPQIPKSFWWNTDSPFLGFRLVRPVNPPSPEEQAAFWALVLGE